MRWADLQRDAPRLGEVAHERLIAPGILLVATIRVDGTPRLSPIEPLLLRGDLWLSMMWRSQKAADLTRDDRVLIHSITTSRDGSEGEVKLRGRAISIDDLELRAEYCDKVSVLGWRPVEPNFHLFRIDIGDLTVIRYEPSGDQRVTRWPAQQEFVRRATSATSVGKREPLVDLLPGDDPRPR